MANVSESGPATEVAALQNRVAELQAQLEWLHQRELRTRLLLTSLPHKLFFKDPQSRFLSVNAAFAAEAHTTPDALVGKSDFDLYPPDLAEKYQRDDQVVMRSRRPVTLVERHVVNGEDRYVEVSKAPVFDDAGSVIGLMGLFTDVTERITAEEAVRESRQLLQAILDNSPAVIYLKDTLGRYVLINQQFERLFNITREAVVGKTDYDIFPKEHADAFRANDQQVLAARKAIEWEEIAPHEDGPHIYLSLKFPINDRTGEPTAVCGISTDITERKKVEAALHAQARQLAEQAVELEQRNREVSKAYAELQDAETQLIHSEKMAAIGQLVAGLAHEINNPASFVLTNLTAIARDLEDLLSYTERCRDLETTLADKAPEVVRQLTRLRRDLALDEAVVEIRSLIESSKKGMLRIRDLVANLRSYSRIDVRGEFGMADLHEGLSATLMLLKPLIAKGVKVELQLGELPLVECNLGQINQVLMNVLVNAVQAVEPTGVVAVATERASDGVLIRIRDNGPGIPKKIRSRIFDPFFTTKEVGKGTGLGLTICRRIVESHQGRLSFETQEGVGTEFQLWLPLRQSKPPADSESS